MLRAHIKPPSYNENKKVKSERGFTIIELMIATSVFSVVLLIVSTGIIRIGQSYYKGLIQASTQETTRTVASEISQTLQFANGTKIPGANLGPGIKQFCIGEARYTAFMNKQVAPGVDGLKVEKIKPDDACDNTTSSVGTDDREMLGTNMRLLKLDVDPIDAQSRTWRVDIRVAYGDSDLLTHYNDDESPVNPSAVLADATTANCKSGIAGGSFCATSQLDILVKKRLN